MLSKKTLEKYSSAVTLSDMEIFIFPELMYSLVLANIMSPRIWEWRNHPWFKKLDKLTTYRKILRLKQFIIDQYDFNLDLETWGLTTQEREVGRFREWVDERTLSESNALFGYEGDKYYFDIDIRRHFGLDKFDGNVIPYWKTETVEAMDAFRFKEGYASGAGECVSLAALYAAALYVICEIPLEDIYLLATPLHSQNFVDVKEGLLTNNRRIVTKAMWFNGTELTEKAQRALRNENVTIVSHCSGYIHTLYPEATIDAERYEYFKGRLQSFLTAEIDMEIIINFLRANHELQKCFQIAQAHHGRTRFLPLEVAYQYEHCGPYKLNHGTRAKLLEDIDEYKWSPEPVEGRVMLSKLENFFSQSKVDYTDEEACDRLLSEFDCHNDNAPEILRRLIDFVYIQPRLPKDKTFVRKEGVHLEPGLSRNQVVSYIKERDAAGCEVAGLALYAFRDLALTAWEPFVKAALERNPACVDAVKDMDLDQIVTLLGEWSDESIYDGTRLAQPDEVWNYQRGDGLEKALCMADIIKNRFPDEKIVLRVSKKRVQLDCGILNAEFSSSKGLEKELNL